MKKRLQGIVVGVLITLLFTNVAAATGIKSSIEVIFNKVRIEINGEVVDQDNILYNGTTYVPLRFMTEKFGYDVDWKEKTNTVSITDMSELDMDYIGHGIIPINVTSDNSTVNHFSMRYKTETDILEDNMGEKYDSYFMLSDNVKEKVHVFFNTDGKYDTFKTKLGLTKQVKDMKQKITFRVYADDKVVYKQTLKAGDKPKDISVDIRNAKALMFEIEADLDNEYYEVALFNNRFIKKK